MKDINNRVYLVFWGFLSLDVLLLLSGVFGIVIPGIGRTMARRNDLALIHKARISVEESLSGLEQSLTFSPIHDELAERLLLIVPNKRQIADIYDEASWLIQHSGFSLAGLNVQEVTKGEGLTMETIQVTARIEGFNYESLKRLVSLLEQAPHIYDLRSVALNPESPQTTLTLITYAYLAGG